MSTRTCHLTPQQWRAHAAHYLKVAKEIIAVAHSKARAYRDWEQRGACSALQSALYCRDRATTTETP